MEQYFKNKINIYLYTIIIIAALNWGAFALNYNLVELLCNFINNKLNTCYPIDKILYGLITIITLYVASKRNFWLPFLDETILPSTLLPLKPLLNANKLITINTRPNTKIVYWAALPRGENPSVHDAYDDYSNSGVVMSDNNGFAHLSIIEGSGYIIPSGTKLQRHVHYREVCNKYPMLSEIKTINY